MGVESRRNRERPRGHGAASSSSSSKNISFIHTERILAVKEDGADQDVKGTGKTDQSQERPSHTTLRATPTTGGSKEAVANKQPTNESVETTDKVEEVDQDEENKVSVNLN